MFTELGGYSARPVVFCDGCRTWVETTVIAAALSLVGGKVTVAYRRARATVADDDGRNETMQSGCGKKAWADMMAVRASHEPARLFPAILLLAQKNQGGL
uniref:Uncharacterized protein n=1 Tax=Strombidinopsis acuminata TaxID=141414 RepID=A0A7S3RKQ8_9SPIT|mmetsp:Transcript_27075/g.82008  ORF Transcript_27075/g.82008 Transcript_27075/m.82008 type:complete len:100 (-) Transcript_27075:927-1226(-)